MNKIETEHGIFTSNETTEQTAEEVYQEWLDTKNNPTPIIDADGVLISKIEVVTINTLIDLGVI